jgi:hypothetical protein
MSAVSDNVEFWFDSSVIDSSSVRVPAWQVGRPIDIGK